MGYTNGVEAGYQGQRSMPVLHALLVCMVGFLVLGLASCAPPKITSQVLIPARAHEAATIRRDLLRARCRKLWTQKKTLGKP